MFELHFSTFSWGRRRGSIIFLIYDFCGRCVCLLRYFSLSFSPLPPNPHPAMKPPYSLTPHSYNYVLLHKALQDPQGTLQQCQDPQAKHKIPQTDLVRSTLWKMRRDHWWDLQLSAKPGCQFPSLTAGNWASQPETHFASPNPFFPRYKSISLLNTICYHELVIVLF